MLITSICDTAEATTSWLSNYSHRVVIPVNATAVGAQTDYQMQIILHSKSGDSSAGNIYLNGNLQDTTNFNDIRFTTSDGTTLKDFWIQKVAGEIGGRKATVYVKLDTPASGSTDYYLYYGKSCDTSASNYDNTFTKDYGESGLVGLWHMDTVPGTELLTDGGLETWTTTTDLTNWTENRTSAARQIVQESTTKQAGSYSVKLLATANDGITDFGIHQDITTVNNEKYQVNFYQEYSSRTQGTLRVEAWDNTHSVSLGSQSIITASTSFSFISFRFTSTNTTNVRIKVYLNNETTGTAYIDALSVKQSNATLTDSSGNSNDGTIYDASRTDTDGGQWDGRSDVVFSTGSALSFDGVNDDVNCGAPASLNITGPVTVEAWIYPKSSGQSGLGRITDKGNYTHLRMVGSGNPNVAFRIYVGGVSKDAVSSGVGSYNNWHYVVGQFDGSNVIVYVDTVKFVGDATSGPIDDHQTVAQYIGNKSGTGRAFDGLIDEVRIYNRALSADEIYRHYIRSKYASSSPTWATPGTQQVYALAVITQSATYIGLTSAALNGYLSGFGEDTSATVYFKWGLSQDDLNHTTASQVFTDYGSFSQPITDLSSDTIYYFQAFVENSSETAQGSIISFKTDALETDYYGIIINTNGSLTFNNKNAATAILSSAPAISFSYLGHGTVTNGTNLDSTLSINGDSITITSVDDNSSYVRITHQYRLNIHSPYISYTGTLQYKQDVFTTEERFDFVVPSQIAQVMTRDLQLTSFDTSKAYWSDLYTPKVVKFANGLSFLGSDTMESMRLRTYGSNSQISFYSDYGQNHPHFYFIKNGGGATISVNETQRTAGDTYSASVTFAIDTNEWLPYLIKTRQPYGYDAILTLTNHPDSETLARIKAVAYGTENESDPDYGKKGIAGRGIGWTKGVFVSGAGSYADLSQAAFKTLIDQMYQDGVVIVGHTITTVTDSRAVVAAGLATLSQYNARCWIDHYATSGGSNWEDLASQGAIKGSDYYILDLLDQYNYQYAWSYIDLTTDNYALNMLKPSATSDIRPFLFYNNRVDDNVNDNKKIYLWSTINTKGTPDWFYTNDGVNTLISERGVHIAHEYYGNGSCGNHVWYNNLGTIEIYPPFDYELAYIAGKQAAGLLWSPPRIELGDYLVPLKDVLVTYNSDGTITVTNNSLVDVTGITLLAENNIQSVTIDNYDLVSFGDSYGDKEMVLPTIASGGSVVLNISYGDKDSSVPTIVSNDTGKNKVNEITGYWDDTSRILTMTAEGRNGDCSFTVTIPLLANRTIMVKDVTINTIIGEYDASDSGAITFTASLGSLHTFKIIVEKPFVDDFDSYGSDCELRNVWHPNPTLVRLNTDPNFVREDTSMKYEYGAYAEVEVNTEDLPYQIRSDWTVEGVKALVLYFYGDPCNSVLPMYVKLIDGSDNEGVVTYGDNGENPNDLRAAGWHEWNIDLAIFDACGVDLTDVEYIHLGFGSGNGSGTVYFDDIRLYPPRCILSRRSADFAEVDYAPAGCISGDCVIDFRDFAVLANEWLDTVDFGNLAVLADMWLEEQLWP